MTAGDLLHPSEDGPSLQAPLHDHGDAADALSGLPRERALAYAAMEQVGPGNPAVALLRRIGSLAAGWTPENGTVRFDLLAMTAEDRALLRQVLGRGEVSGRIDGEAPASFAEAVCPGIWMVGGPDGDRIEVGAMPVCVAETAERLPPPSRPDAACAPADLMNALPVLGEVQAHAESWRPGQPPHVVNLTLLPMTEADRAFLDGALGNGGIAFESRGYGFARIEAAACRRVWRVRFYNAMGAAIQETIEIAAVPSGAAATPEDVQDGGHRLLSILAIYA